ncbi:hypothetical protein FOVG_18719 [Fusarium oxysporum f. sp. pisi HDV247]|uniref:Uncharacterized protein n=1 Tax=Fusarium oxysporum f. sp. pisi HDV247 TaxID=1080344 RepID=W9NAT4_FUSOX|nr:hypothetical protein FOVG_18719 [Fusarium oxysporum f. sp. pisi HDV247]KAK2685272.1 hypothetical protein QWA68_016180 [Fusarium oxysporum]
MPLEEEAVRKGLRELRAEGRRIFAKEANQVSVIRPDTNNDKELVSLVNFGCKVLWLPGLYPSRRRWLDEELRLLERLD